MSSLDFARDVHTENRAKRDPETPTTANLKHDPYSGRVTVEDWVQAAHHTPHHIGHVAPAGNRWVWIDTDGNGGTADTQALALQELLDALDGPWTSGEHPPLTRADLENT